MNTNTTTAEQEERDDEGFTLIELLIVIVILGVLAAIVTVSLSGVGGNAQDAACDAERRAVRTAVSALSAETGDPAGTIAALDTDGLTHLYNSNMLDTIPTLTAWDVANDAVIFAGDCT